MNKIFFVLSFSILYLLHTAFVTIPPVFGQQDKVTIKIGYEPDLAPLNLANSGNAVGFSIDLLREISKNKDFDIVFIPMVKGEALKKITSGEIDLISSVQYSSQLASIIEYSDPIFTSSIGILTPKQDNQLETLSILSDVLVAIQNDTLEYDFLKNIRRIKYQVCNSQHTALKFFLAGRADVFVGNIDTANYYLEQYSLHTKYQFSNAYLIPVDYSFAVAKNNYALLSMLNSGVRQLKSTGVYGRLYRKWFDQEAEALSDLVRLIWEIGAGVAAVFLVIVFLSVRWNRQLKKQVARKTLDLQVLNESLVKQIEITNNNNEFLKQVLDSSPRGIIILNHEGYITKSNIIASTFLNRNEPLKGRHFRDIPFLYELIEGKFEPVLSGQKKHFLGEHHELNPSSKRPQQLRYYVYPLYQYDQKINGLILTFEDVTAELEVQKKLFEQEKNRALSRMVAGIAHEVRNPLSSIKTFIELIPRKIDNQRFQKELAATVPREIVRINRLIEGLISYARPREVKNELVSMKKLIDETALLFQHSIRSKGFHLMTEDVEDLMVMTDHDQIKQVIINLVINAIDALKDSDHSKNKLTIELKAFRTAQHVCIQVVDNGNGMSKEEQVNSLEPFYTTKPKGTGLGLPLAQQLVKENSGELIIESEKNIGTTVTIYFNQVEG